MLRGMAVSAATASVSSAAAQGNQAIAYAMPHDPRAVSSNSDGVKADANLDWDVDKGDDDFHSTEQSGARNLGYGGEPDFSSRLDKDFPDCGAAPAPAPSTEPADGPSVSMTDPAATTAPPSVPRRLSEVVRRMLGSKLSDSAARVASAAAASISASAQSVKGAFSAAASNGHVSASARGDWTVDKEDSGAVHPQSGAPARGEASWAVAKERNGPVAS
jgi:hypothetical protein